MTRQEIVARLAAEKRVETMVCNIAHTRLSSDLQDLCQMIYLLLLEYDEDKIIDLYANGEINFFLARVILNQFRSPRSQFHALFRKYQLRSTDISKRDFIDG